MKRITVIIGAVVVLGLFAFIGLTRLGVFGPRDGLDCPSNLRGHTTLDFVNPHGHGSTPDEEIERSDLWKFLDVPQAAWRIVASGDEPEDGILCVDPRDRGDEDRHTYLVFADGQAIARVGVEPLGGRYVVSGYIGC